MMKIDITKQSLTSICDTIVEKCKKYSHIQYQRTNNSITILPLDHNGFPVTYSFDNNQHSVSFLGWSENFNNPQEALNCFAFGLSKKCRLKIYKKRDFQYKWIVESQNENKSWLQDSYTSLLFFPFWIKTEIIYLQNNLLE